MISELVEDESCIADRQYRNQKVKELARKHGTTVKRIQKLYFRHLAGRPLLEERQVPEKPETAEQKDFAWAIVQEKLQEHFAEKFQNSILMKAREGAPELPELDGTGLHQTKSHRH